MNVSTENNAVHARRRSLFWRIHFWAALLASPFTLIATLTGLLYVFTPQIEALLYDKLDRVMPAGQMRTLDEAVAAARASVPENWQLHSVIPPLTAQDSVKIRFTPPMEEHTGHSGHHHGSGAKAGEVRRPAFGLPANATVVYVDPYRATVLGSLGYQERFSIWSRKLHSSLLQGENWRWMIELAASWMMVMLLTGIWLWWPRPGQAGLPQARAKGRALWKQWHAFLGVTLSLVSLVILATGITWSKYAGDQVRAARDWAGQGPPQAPRGLKSVPLEGSAALDWQQAWEAARRHAPSVSMQLTAPHTPEATWRIASADNSQPTRRFDLQLDAYSGAVLYSAGWKEQTAFGKATAIGIPFHRGEFGWWNQAILLVFGIGLLFSLVSGWVMFFKRRKPGSFVLPPLLPGAWKSASRGMWVTAGAMLIALPVLAVSAAGVLILEMLLAIVSRTEKTVAH